MSEILAATEAGDRAQVAVLLNADPALARTRTPGGVPLAMHAIYYGQPAIADALVAAGAPVDAFLAAATGRTATIETLLDADRALVHAAAADGFGALGLACFFGHEGCAALLLARGADPNQAAANTTRVQPLHSAVAGGHAAIVVRLLAAGADVHARQADGFVPLHAAAQNNRADIVAALLAAGADPTAATDDGRTARDFAANAPAVLALL